jgi:mono/diheme cytochrome c family protein
VNVRINRALLGVMAFGLAVTAAVAAPKKPAKKPAPAGKPDAKAGMAAFKSEGCVGCHKTKDYATGGEVGPDLSAVAGEKKLADITAYIAKPKAGSVMPPFKGPKPVLDNLGAYLMTQK